MDSAILAVIGTVFGAIVGAGATLFARRQADEAADRRAAEERHDRDRELLRRAVNEFIAATQHAERIAGEGHHRGDAKSEATHDMWVRHKQLTLICTDGLAARADNLAERLNTLMWKEGERPLHPPVWEQISDDTWQFRQSARQEIRRLK